MGLIGAQKSEGFKEVTALLPPNELHFGKHVIMVLTVRWRALATVLKDAWPIWTALGGIGSAIAVPFLFSATLPGAIRYTGTILQLLGLAAVAIGLNDLRRYFGRPSFFRKILAWSGRLAATFKAPKPISLQVSGREHVISWGEPQGIRGVEPGASIEKRVSVLEENLDFLRKELKAKEHKIEQEISTLKGNIQRESQERRIDNQQTARMIEDVAVGGLHLEIIGLIWLVLGILGTSISDEITAFLCLLGCASR